MTKLDVLDGLDELKICTAYASAGSTSPSSRQPRAWLVRSIYETMPGWKEPTRGARTFDELPAEAQNYVARLEELSGVGCAIVSTGSDRDETIIRDPTRSRRAGSRERAQLR